MNKIINHNARRFFREDMLCKYHISPMSFNLFGSIPYTGFDYYPIANVKKFNLLQTACVEHINKIKDHKEIIEHITQAFIESVMSFKKATQLLSLGKNLEELDEQSTATFKSLKNGIPIINEIRDKGNKTYNSFKTLEEKLIYYTRQLDQIMTLSSPDVFYEVPIENIVFSADKQYEMFKKSEKSTKIPLIKLMMRIYEMIEFNVEIFRDICIDCIGRVNPNIWNRTQINISEGGCSLELRKRFQTNDKLLVCLQPTNTKAISIAEANIVNVIENPKDFNAKVALQFYFFRNETQTNIERAIQIQEIEQSMDVIRRRS